MDLRIAMLNDITSDEFNPPLADWQQVRWTEKCGSSAVQRQRPGGTSQEAGNELAHRVSDERDLIVFRQIFVALR